MIAEINNFASLSLHAFASKNIGTVTFAILLADGLVLIAICAYVFVMFPLRKKGEYTRTLFHDFIPGATAIAVGELWKLVFPVIRPFAKLGFSPLSPTFDTMGSFPSLHAAFIAAFATTLFFYHRRLGIFVAILVPFVMIGRVAVGVHWLTDVFAGALFGLIIAIAFRKNDLKRPH